MTSSTRLSLAHVASLKPANAAGTAVEKLDPVPPALLDLDFREWIDALEEELARQSQVREVSDAERAILVSVTGGRSRADVDVQLAGLETSVPFQADLESDQPLLAYWYEVTNSADIPTVELPEEPADTTGTGNGN